MNGKGLDDAPTLTDTPPLVVGITGCRSTGKDTLCTHLRSLDPRVQRFAFADALKRDLAPFIAQHFGIDVFTATGEDKELIRPLLISYGMARRERDPLVWCRKTTDLIVEKCEAQRSPLQARNPFVPVVTDVRFVNEVNHLRETFGTAFTLVNVSRAGAPPPTDEEELHYRDVAALADYHVKWGNDTQEQQLAHARRLHDWLGAMMGTGW